MNTALTTGEVPKEADEKGLSRRIFQAKKDPDTGKELPATQFVIDLFAFHTDDRKKMLTSDLENDLEKVKERITDFADITLDVAPLGKVKFDDDYSGKYPEQVSKNEAAEGEPQFTLRVNGESSLTNFTQLYINRIMHAKNKPLWDICFKLELNEEFEKMFIEKGDEQEAIFAWVWVINWSTWKQYKDIFGIDITDKQQRLEHLKKPQDISSTQKGYVPVIKIPAFAASTVRLAKKLETKLIKAYNESLFVKEGKEFQGTILGEIGASREEYQKQYSTDLDYPDQSTTADGLKKLFRVRNWERYIGFGVTALKEHTSFKPHGNGLFKNNPLLLIDDVRPAEAITDARKKAVADFYKDIELGLGTFVASYAFADSDVGDLYDLFWKGEAGEKKATTIKAIKAMLFSEKSITSTLMKKMIARAGIKETVINRVIVVGELPDKLKEAAKNFDDKIRKVEHPFMDTVDFGTSPDHFDSVYLLAATQVKRILDSKTGHYKVAHDPGRIVAVTLLNRFIDIGQGQPFNYQMDKNSGFVERAENLKNAFDSVSVYRIEFQQNLQKVMKTIRRLQAEAGNKMGTYYDSLMNGSGLEQIFSKTGNNFSPQFQFSPDKEKALIKKAFTNPQAMSMDDMTSAVSILKFLEYVDASYATYPKCGAIMKASWGWCPYHGTREKMPIADNNTDGSFEVEFFNEYGEFTLDMLRSESYIVHWTEFILLRK